MAQNNKTEAPVSSACYPLDVLPGVKMGIENAKEHTVLDVAMLWADPRVANLIMDKFQKMGLLGKDDDKKGGKGKKGGKKEKGKKGKQYSRNFESCFYTFFFCYFSSDSLERGEFFDTLGVLNSNLEFFYPYFQ